MDTPDRPKRIRVPRKEFDDNYDDPKARPKKEGEKRGRKRERDEEDDEFVDVTLFGPTAKRRKLEPDAPVMLPQVHYAPVGTTLTDDASFLASFMLTTKPESISPTFTQRLNDAKSLVPAKKIWVLHSHRHNASEWDLYLCQGSRLVTKQGATLVSIGSIPSCTCDDFTKNRSPCCHLLFAYVVIFNIPEIEESILQSLALSTDQLLRIFSGAPSESSAFPRLAPANITRVFYSWFDGSVSEVTRKSAFLNLLAKEQSPQPPIILSASDPFSFPLQTPSNHLGAPPASAMDSASFFLPVPEEPRSPRLNRSLGGYSNSNIDTNIDKNTSNSVSFDHQALAQI
jgi:hypothetical protein